jgi:hypothetical protein
MRYTEYIGNTADTIERYTISPKYYPCPQCGRKGKRKQVITRQIRHLAALHRRAWIVAQVGVYRARCGCRQYFQAAIPGVPYRGRYSFEVRNQIANALIRDRMPYRLVQQRLGEDHLLKVSVGYIHACFLWAHAQLNREDHWQFVRANFSGVLCIDEVHDSGRIILFATDPLNDFTVSFQLVEVNDQAHMDAFLQQLKEQGLEVRVAISDGSPLYKDSLQSHWLGLEHQLCVFHVIKEVNKLILEGVRAIKNRLRRQGNKGRKRGAGRPSQRILRQRQRRQGMSKHDQATFIWEHQYLIVRKEDELTDEDREDLALMLAIAPELALFRRFNQQFYRLFEKDLSRPQARYRRTRLINYPDYQANPFLARALKKLAKDKFEKMIVSLGWENVDRTNNHVERNNRVFRMLQKTRYKRRKQHTIEKALELDLYARMIRHPLHQHQITILPLMLKEPSPLKRAA